MLAFGAYAPVGGKSLVSVVFINAAALHEFVEKTKGSVVNICRALREPARSSSSSSRALVDSAVLMCANSFPKTDTSCIKRSSGSWPSRDTNIVKTHSEFCF